MKYFLLTCFFLGAFKVFSQPYGYTYAKEITIQSSQVAGATNHTNFPVLVSLTDNDLRTTGNGGRITNTNGYDIIFTSSDCLTILDHQIESYTPTTGAYVAWVRIPTLSVSTNTVIHMYYSNSAVVTNPSATSVWDANYRAVWHFNNSVNDNSANGNNLTNVSTTNLAAGKIAAARDLNNSTNVLSSNATGQHLRLANGFFSGMTNFTFEGWVLLDRSATNWERIFDFGQSTTVNFFLCPSTGTGSSATTNARITINGAGNEQGPVSENVTNTGSWIHWAVVLNNATSTMILYKNGAALATASGTVTLTPQNLEATTANYFGRSQYGADHYIDAKFDEFRISNSARSAGWITTSYNNQNTPSSFYAVSGEVTAGTLCAPLPIKLNNFKATPVESGVEVTWSTLSEINNEYFTLERSTDGIAWDAISTVKGAGNSTHQLNYSYTDKLLITGRYYYRLRQNDYDGSFEYSGIESVYFAGARKPLVYTNHETRELIVTWSYDEPLEVIVNSAVGQHISLPEYRSPGKVHMSTSDLPAGIYIVRIHFKGGSLVHRIYIR